VRQAPSLGTIDRQVLNLLGAEHSLNGRLLCVNRNGRPGDFDDFIGSADRQLDVARGGYADLNINYGEPGDAAGANARRKFFSLANTTAISDWAARTKSRYNSLQVALNRPFKNGLLLKGAYTLSKAKDMTTSGEDGSFTGAYRASDGSTLVNASWIVDGKTKMEEFNISKEGVWTPLRTSDDYGYDPRTRPFYTRAFKANQPIWTPLVVAIASMAVCACRLNAPAAPSIPMTSQRTVQSRRASPNSIAANSTFTTLKT